VDPPRLDRRLKAAVTAESAIGDLPAIHARTAMARGDLVRGARQLDTEAKWDERRTASAYATLMQTWPGFEASETGVTAHVIRWLPRDYETFARMRQGDQYPEALEIEALETLGRKAPKEGSAAWRRLRASIVPPYDDGKFPNKWRKLWRHEPARTLMAHLGKDSYSHIHYDSRQARTISVREAARLQSFPDGFVFKGAMNQAFRQIGNAVPPLMAAAIAREMLSVLRRGRLQRSAKRDDKARSI
jgi:DNA (cytosine-5)-methyltransferase 1